jgi:7,8-dihydropterin-6-yl-methyl-4-(beta-D-ribofuranosyl)aminobenzene 5'-phosphate synthase
MDTVAITLLADNLAEAPFQSEHGFSALIQGSGTAFPLLFDTGRGVLFENARLAGIDLNQVKTVVLSHGHYDHTDALDSFLAQHPNVQVWASDKIFRPHYSTSTQKIRPIGVSSSVRSALEVLPPGQFVRFSGSVSLADGRVHLAENIPRTNAFELPSPLLFADEKAQEPDTIPDELTLWIKTRHGLVLLTGCGHAGLVNTCEHVLSLAPHEKIHTVLGGFHLKNIPQRRLEETRDYLKRKKIVQLVPCHCTGEEATDFFKQESSFQLTQGRCGLTITVE